MKKLTIMLLAVVAVGAVSTIGLSEVFAKDAGKDSSFSQLINRLDLLIEAISNVNGVEEQEDEDTMSLSLQTTATEYTNGDCFTGYESWPKSGKYKHGGLWNMDLLLPPSTGSNYLPNHYGFLDLNGDGLQDYYYKTREFSFDANGCTKGSRITAYKQDGSLAWFDTYTCLYDALGRTFDTGAERVQGKNTCVLLNNGSGWDLEYRCVMRYGPREEVYNYNNLSIYYNQKLYFYGDCADMTP